MRRSSQAFFQKLGSKMKLNQLAKTDLRLLATIVVIAFVVSIFASWVWFDGTEQPALDAVVPLVAG